MAEPRYFRLCHPAAILLQIKYKKSEPLADRLQVRISRVWWSIGESNPVSLRFAHSAGFAAAAGFQGADYRTSVKIGITSSGSRLLQWIIS